MRRRVIVLVLAFVAQVQSRGDEKLAQEGSWKSGGRPHDQREGTDLDNTTLGRVSGGSFRRIPSVAFRPYGLPIFKWAQSSSRSRLRAGPIGSLSSFLSGAEIKQATKDQLTLVFPDQVLDEVAALTTEAIFEPPSRDLARKIERYVVDKLIDRFGPKKLDENALFLAFNNRQEIVGVVGVAVEALTPEGQSSGENVADRPLLEFLSVDPSERGKGIAKSLVKRVEAQARSWGYDDVILQVLEDNMPAIRLYKQMGYKVIAEDDMIMRPKSLGLFGGVNFEPQRHLCMRKELGWGIPGLPNLFQL